MMFALPPGTSAKLVNVNIRAELHGTETVPQADMRFEVALTNAFLDALDPALRTCLYRPAPPPHPAAMLPELPGIAPVSDTPALRFPELGMPLKWEEEGAGYALTVTPMVHGTAPPLMLREVTVGAIRLDCLDGGTVGVDFRVQTTHAPDVETIAELARYVQRTVTIELTPPEPASNAEIDTFAEADEAAASAPV
ncbi:MAG TPA: hypothetical protein VK955_06420 [Xanthobacteraceae bacterium]|nr:hypothetical protein [Xanthobacteraceae bacterium]